MERNEDFSVRWSVLSQQIFPIVNLDANDSDMIMDVIEHYKGKYDVRIVETGYEFQKHANRLLIIKRV